MSGLAGWIMRLPDRRLDQLGRLRFVEYDLVAPVRRAVDAGTWMYTEAVANTLLRLSFYPDEPVPDVRLPDR